MYTMIGTTAEYQSAMSEKDRRELACEKVCGAALKGRRPRGAPWRYAFV